LIRFWRALAESARFTELEGALFPTDSVRVAAHMRTWFEGSRFAQQARREVGIKQVRRRAEFRRALADTGLEFMVSLPQSVLGSFPLNAFGDAIRDRAECLQRTFRKCLPRERPDHSHGAVADD
jgi:hypothetical protein